MLLSLVRLIDEPRSFSPSAVPQTLPMFTSSRKLKAIPGHQVLSRGTVIMREMAPGAISPMGAISRMITVYSYDTNSTYQVSDGTPYHIYQAPGTPANAIRVVATLSRDQNWTQQPPNRWRVESEVVRCEVRDTPSSASRLLPRKGK